MRLNCCVPYRPAPAVAGSNIAQAGLTRIRGQHRLPDRMHDGRTGHA